MGHPRRFLDSTPLIGRCSLAPVLTLLATGCSVPLVENLDETTATDVVIALSDGDIGATKERDPNVEGRFRVLVANDDVAPALVTLDGAGLPGRHPNGVLDVMDDSALVPSRSAEKARLLVGTAGELERTLSDVSGVLSARVHLAVSEQDPLSPEAKAPASASVLLRHSGSTPPLSVEDLRLLVAGAVNGLRPEAVAVVMHPVVAPPSDNTQRLTQVGPLSITRSSAATLRWLLAGIAGLNLLLLAGMLLLWTRLRLARQRNETATAPKASGA